MENAVKYTKEFLNGKGIGWDGQLYERATGEYYKVDEQIHFDGDIFIAELRQGEKKMRVGMFISEKYFMLFDYDRYHLKADFSNEWKNFLAVERRKQALRNAYGVSSKNPMSNNAIQRELTKIDLSGDVKIAIEKGDNDGLPQSVKTTLFDGKKLEGKPREKFEEFKADLEADNINLI